MKSINTPETSVYFYQTTQRSILEDSHIHTRSCENLKSQLLFPPAVRNKEPRPYKTAGSRLLSGCHRRVLRASPRYFSVPKSACYYIRVVEVITLMVTRMSEAKDGTQPACVSITTQAKWVLL
jgi:hypothetical protein